MGSIGKPRTPPLDSSAHVRARNFRKVCQTVTALAGFPRRFRGATLPLSSGDFDMSRHFLARGLMSSVALLAFSAAFAQTAPQKPAPAAQQPVATEPGGGQIEEVVVTATRRSEFLSKVPESVSAFTTEKMDTLGIKNFADVARFTPGVSFGENDNSLPILGINSSGGSGTPGIYIDDTPIQIRAVGFGSDNTLPALFD